MCKGSYVLFLQTLVKKKKKSMDSYSLINISCSPTAHPDMHSGITDMYPSTFLSINDTSEQFKTTLTHNNGRLVKHGRHENTTRLLEMVEGHIVYVIRHNHK